MPGGSDPLNDLKKNVKKFLGFSLATIELTRTSNIEKNEVWHTLLPDA